MSLQPSPWRTMCDLNRITVGHVPGLEGQGQRWDRAQTESSGQPAQEQLPSLRLCPAALVPLGKPSLGAHTCWARALSRADNLHLLGTLPL